MKETKRRIKEIIDLLAGLTLETSQLTQELQVLVATADLAGAYSPPGTDKTTQPRADVNPFKTGDVVVITNNYRAKEKGQVGVITKVTKRQMTLKNPSGKSFTRKFTNVELQKS